MSADGCAPYDFATLRFTRQGEIVDRWEPAMVGYLVLIRGPEDPDRAPRWSEQDPTTRGERPTKDANKRTKLDRDIARAALAADVRAHPATTYNAACVRCFDTTADVTNDVVEEALWSLVEDGTVVHTFTAPVRFIYAADYDLIDVEARAA